MRPDGWRERLFAWAVSQIGAPFEWGRNDCALICLEAVDRIRGRSGAAAQYRGRWTGCRAALRFQEKEGMELAAALEREGAFRWRGMPETGDLVLHPHPGLDFTCGHVVLGFTVLSSNEENGVYVGQLAAALTQPGAFVMRVC